MTTPFLLGISGSVKNKRWSLDSDLTLGRDAANSVCLDSDTTASRNHATVFRRGPDTLIKDLGSTNGTYVNGARLAPHEERVLRHRDVVRIGDCRFIEMEREQAVTEAVPAADVERIRRMGTVRVLSPEDWAARDREAAVALIR